MYIIFIHLYMFPRAATVNYYQFSGLKQNTFILPQIWSQVTAEQALSKGYLGELILVSSSS